MQMYNPTGRATECRAITIKGMTLYFSYQIMIGVQTTSGRKFRIANQWVATTDRHIRECGLDSAVLVGQNELQNIVESNLSLLFGFNDDVSAGFESGDESEDMPDAA